MTDAKDEPDRDLPYGGDAANAEEDAREIAQLLSGALPGGYGVRLRVTETPLPDGVLPDHSRRSSSGRAFRAELEMYRRQGDAVFRLVVPIAGGGWCLDREDACAGLLREFGSMRRVRYRNSGAGLTVCFPAAGTPEELGLRLAVEGCSTEGENALSL